MIKKNLLHKNKLEQFKTWLEKKYGRCIHKTKGKFEVLRWCRDNEYNGPMPIIYNGKSREHLSCNEAAIPYVRKFIRQSKTK